LRDRRWLVRGRWFGCGGFGGITYSEQDLEKRSGKELGVM
jgi:hypothetical protein